MRVGYYQNNPEFGKVAENVDRIAAKLEDAEADLLVLPELCASGYQFVSHGRSACTGRADSRRTDDEAPAGSRQAQTDGDRRRRARAGRRSVL